MEWRIELAQSLPFYNLRLFSHNLRDSPYEIMVVCPVIDTRGQRLFKTEMNPKNILWTQQDVREIPAVDWVEKSSLRAGWGRR